MGVGRGCREGRGCQVVSMYDTSGGLEDRGDRFSCRSVAFGESGYRPRDRRNVSIVDAWIELGLFTALLGFSPGMRAHA